MKIDTQLRTMPTNMSNTEEEKHAVAKRACEWSLRRRAAERDSVQEDVREVLRALGIAQ